MKKALKRFNQTAIISFGISLTSLVLGLSINMVIAATWQDPTAVAPNLGDLEPPLNTSLLAQEKTGGIYLATAVGGLRVGSGVAGGEKMYVLGNTFTIGNSVVDGNIDVALDTDVSALNAGSSTINNLGVGSELMVVDDAAKVLINSALPLGLLTVRSDAGQGIVAGSNYATGNVIYLVNQNASSGSGINGSGKEYGIHATTGAAGITVLGDGTSLATATGGGMYAKGNDNVYGLVGRGLYGLVGLDNTENINNPVFVGSGKPVAGLFEGSVDIIPSTGGNGDLVVDTDTFVVKSLTNNVGVGTANPDIRLHVEGENNIPALYGVAGMNSTVSEYGSPTQTVAGVYGEGDTVSYKGGGIGWNFGVYGKAGDSGNSRTAGIMGVDYGSGDTYAGWFDGELAVDGKLSVTTKLRTYDASGMLTVNSDIIGNSDLNLIGTDSDINLTGTDSDIFLTGQLSTGREIEYMGKLNMYGGLPAYGTQNTTCTVAPSEYYEGTMYTCNWCPTPFGERYFAIMVRMNMSWVNIGYGKGGNCGTGTYDPEDPLQPCPNC